MKKILQILIFFFLPSLLFSQSHICSHAKSQIKTNKAFAKRASYKRQTEEYDLKYHRLEWFVNPDSLFIQGAVTSYFQVVSNTLEDIYFDLDSIFTIDSVLYHGIKLKNSFIEVDFLEINLNTILHKNDFDSISVYYHGVPATHGFGSFSKDLHNSNPIIWTLSEPYGAQDWWPCKQSLNDKIDSIDIYVTTIKGNRVGSNGVLISEVVDGNFVTYFWKHRYPIPAYLIAIAVTNYSQFSHYVHYQGDSMEILNYVYPEDSQYYVEPAYHTVAIMEFFMGIFGIYPFFNEKYGHAQFSRGGGMEHQTMTFLVNFDEYLVGHELAHQWFGDKITCESWSEIWLNEGFATYSEGLIKEHFHSDYAFYQWRRSHIQAITKYPGGSVYVYGNDTLNVSRVFDYRLSYRKGGLVLHMLRFILGDEDFFKAIKRYMLDPKLAYKYASTPDLQNHFESASGKDLDYFFDDWIYNQGYPSYSIEWTQIADEVKLEVSQTQSHSSVSFFELPLEIRFEGDNKDTTVIFDNEINNQKFSFNLSFKVDTVIFDRNMNIISANNIVHYNDPSGFEDDDFLLFPNPIGDNKSLTLIFLSNISVDEIIITSIDGKIVKKLNYNGQYFKKGSWLNLNLIDLRSGRYLINIYSGKKMYYEKLLKL